MANYRLSNVAKDDLIRIHRYGTRIFGEAQADFYYDALFKCFDIISERPLSFESIDYLKAGYRRCVCGADSIYFRLANDGVVEIMTIVGKQDLSDSVK